MNEYRITIVIEGAEESATFEFITEARSIEEARRNIENDLDI